MQANREGISRNHELYREFIEFVRADVQRERDKVNRRMFSAFFWCFIVPAVASTLVLTLVKFRVLPMSARGLLDWTILASPIMYSLYVLSSEVLAQMPASFRRGGTAGVLSQSLKDTQWREFVCARMRKAVPANPAEWRWLVATYRIDLQALQYRTRYLTALAGAVFFLLMQGIDTLGDVTIEAPAQPFSGNPLMGWLESSSNGVSEFVALGLFLLLLYLSGSQTYYSLVRYLDCAELNLLSDQDKRS